MMVYVGNAGAKRVVQHLKDSGLGRMVTAASWKNPVPGLRWALDNGAFSDWNEGKPFDRLRFLRTLDKVPSSHRPDFGVIPDVVAGGGASLAFSIAWLPRLPHGWPWYLAVQDGMRTEDLDPHVNEISGIFVGGTLDWKLETAEAWVAYGQKHGLPTHIGRVGTFERLVWARRIGATSVDSSTFVQGADPGREDKLGRIPAARAQELLEVAHA